MTGKTMLQELEETKKALAAAKKDAAMVFATRTSANDVLTMLLKVRDAMVVNGDDPDVEPFLEGANPEKTWYDPRRPLATDVCRALAGLTLKYHGAVPPEVEEHAAHGRRFFGGAACQCLVCKAHRVSLEEP